MKRITAQPYTAQNPDREGGDTGPLAHTTLRFWIIFDGADAQMFTTLCLEAQARAVRMLAEGYLSNIVARALERQRTRNTENLSQHLDQMPVQVAPDTTPQQMEKAVEEALTQFRSYRTWPR